MENKLNVQKLGYEVGDGKNYVIIVYGNGTTKELSVVSNVYSISTGPYNYCCVGVLYQGGARIYTFLATSAPDSLTYYTPGMFTPNAVIQGGLMLHQEV